MGKSLARRKFLQLSSIALGSFAFERSLLAGNSLEAMAADDDSKSIFVDVDSMAFFNAPARNKAVDISMLEQSIPMHWPIRQEVSYYLVPESKQYFNAGKKDKPVVVAVLSECIMFCCYTQGNDGSIISSGAYHAMTLKPEKELQENLGLFISTIRPNQYDHQRTFLKASGRYGHQDQEEVIRSIEGLLRGKSIRIRELSLESSQATSKISKFYPNTGRLTTEKVSIKG